MRRFCSSVSRSGSFGSSTSIDVGATHRPVLAHQRQDQVQVVLLVEAPLADVPARLAGRLGDGTRDDQVRIAALDQAGGLQATVLVAARSAASSAPGRAA